MTGYEFVLSHILEGESRKYKTNACGVVLAIQCSIFIKGLTGLFSGLFWGLLGCMFVFLCIYIGMRCLNMSSLLYRELGLMYECLYV